MTPNELAHNLRLRFCVGATPVSLIKEIYDRYLKGELQALPRWQFAVSNAFRAAFGFPLIRLPDQIESLDENETLRDHLNLELLHEMVVYLDTWEGLHTDYDIREQWLGNLTAKDVYQHIKYIESTGIPSIGDEWQTLSQTVKEFAVRCIANDNLRGEQIAILTRLTHTLSESQNHESKRRELRPSSTSMLVPVS